MKPPVPLVLIERCGAALNQILYTRILGRAVTHKAKSDEPLERVDLEAFRVDPDKVLGNQEGDAA